MRRIALIAAGLVLVASAPASASTGGDVRHLKRQVRALTHRLERAEDTIDALIGEVDGVAGDDRRAVSALSAQIQWFSALRSCLFYLPVVQLPDPSRLDLAPSGSPFSWAVVAYDQRCLDPARAPLAGAPR